MKKFLYLLLSCILFNTTSAQKLKKLGIEIEDRSYNFGEIQMWENQPAFFELTNNSDRPISILPLFSEFDLEIIYPEKDIKPGEKAIIQAIYYTSGTGAFVREFPIYFNISPESYNLRITGNIKTLSPTAYIQCPQNKPEHSKQKIDLFGNVAEIESRIPISGSTVKIVGVGTKVNLTLSSDKLGNFDTKLPVGNYEVFVDHPDYQNHQSIFYLGQQTGVLKVRLTPNEATEVIALADLETEDVIKKNTNLNNDIPQNPPEQVEEIVIPSTPQTEDQQELSAETIETKPAENDSYNPGSYPVEYETKPETEEKEDLLQQDIYERSSPPVSAVQDIEPINLNEYIVRVINEIDLKPIENANVSILAVTENLKTSKAKTNQEGLISFQLKKADYKIEVTADHYTSGEAYIQADQDEDIIRVYLRPIADIFEDIYTAKKEDALNNELLSELSFGTNEFSFAEDSIDSTPESTTDVIIESQESPEPINELVEVKTITPGINIDSIQTYLVELEAQKEALELSLLQASEELDRKENEIAEKEIALASKDEDLIEQALKLERAKEELDSLDLIQESLTELINNEEVLPVDAYAANNILFLLDVSYSMSRDHKMELLKESLKSLTEVLRDIDRVAIIAYNQKTNIILESISGDNKSNIFNAIDSLETSGLTYGVKGLQTAYELIQYYYIGDGNNQIILATDGLFSSVNATMTENELNKEVRKQASENGIKLSVIGFGQDDEGQKLMQKLANNGDGQFIQIKNNWEAQTVLVEEIKINSKK